MILLTDRDCILRRSNDVRLLACTMVLLIGTQYAWGQNARQVLGPWGSNVPNDHNKPILRWNPSHQVPSYNSTYPAPQPWPPSMGVPAYSYPDIHQETVIALTSGLTDEPGEELDLIPFTDPASAPEKGSSPDSNGGRSYFWWFAVALVAGGVLTRIGRRKVGLVVAAGAVVVGGSSWLMRSHDNSVRLEVPDVRKCENHAWSASPIPDFATFKERASSQNAFYRRQALRRATRFGELALPLLLEQRGFEEQEIASQSIEMMGAPGVSALLRLSRQTDDPGLRERVSSALSRYRYQQPYQLIRLLPFDEHRALMPHPEPSVDRWLREFARARQGVNVPVEKSGPHELDDDLFQGKISPSEFKIAVAKSVLPALVKVILSDLQQYLDENPSYYQYSTSHQTRLLKISSALGRVSSFGLAASPHLAELKKIFEMSFCHTDFFRDGVEGHVYRNAATALAACGAEGMEFLIETMMERPGFRREPIIDALNSGSRNWDRTVSPRAMAFLRTLLEQSSDQGVTGTFKWLLARLGDSVQLESVIEKEFGSRGGWYFEDVKQVAKRCPRMPELASQCIRQNLATGNEVPHGALAYFLESSGSFPDRDDLLELLTAKYPDTVQAIIRKTNGDPRRLLRTMLQSAKSGTALSGSHWLVKAGASIVAFLREELREDRGARSRETILSLLYLMGPAAFEAGPEVAQLTRSKIPEVRFAAIRALSTIGSEDKHSFAALLDSIKDSNWAVREFALKGLKRFEDRAAAAMPQVLDCLQNGKEDEKILAANLLVAMGPAARPAMEVLAKQPPDGPAGAIIATALANIRSE